MKKSTVFSLLTLAMMLCTLLALSCIKINSADNEPPPPPPDYPWTIKYDSLGLPLPTQEGKGIVGFLLNDSVWLPGCGSLLDPSLRAIYSDGIQLNVLNRCTPLDRELHIRTISQTPIGVFGLSDNLLEGFDAYYIDYKTQKTYMCSLSAGNRTSYTVDFYDPQKRIRSGKFEMVMYRLTSHGFPGDSIAYRDQYLDLTDSIVIRAGRFDIVGYY
jgi:hypothetical protein